jgi:urea carboxylase
MDSLAFRIANRLVGNKDREAGLEFTIIGPKLKFLCDAVIALTGASLKETLNGEKVPFWEALVVEKGSVLSLGQVSGPGCRAYLAVAGGIDVPDYLGSKSTFPKGGFGGFKGRPLEKGDRIPLSLKAPVLRAGRKLDSEKIPRYGNEWEVGAIPGPHAAPDYFTPAYEEIFYSTKWRIHRNSNRLGYRLEGPRPQFARTDGGEGGCHSSNIIDCAYATGTVDFAGDIPIILTVDGPSLGGYVALGTIPTSELWKIGQAKPHNYIHFKKMTTEEAVKGLTSQERLLAEVWDAHQ